MRHLKGNFSREKTDEVKRRVDAISKLVCTNDISSCTLGGCKYFDCCQLVSFKYENLPDRNRPLDAKLKIIQDAFNKKKNRLNPNYRPEGVHNICSFILGEDIYEHELIKDSESAKKRIRNATTLYQICEILNQRHFIKYGFKKSFPY